MPRLARTPAARVLGVHPQTLRAWQKTGKIEAVFVNGRWLFEVPEEKIEEARKRLDAVRADELARKVASLRQRLDAFALELEEIQRGLEGRRNGTIDP